MGGRRKRRSRMPRWMTEEVGGMPMWGVAAAGAFILVLGLVAVLAMPQDVSATREPAPISTVTPAPASPEPVSVEQPAAAMSLLDDSARPFTMAVIGDSTGAIPDNWVYRTAEWLSQTYDRPVDMNQWSVRVEPNAYQPVERIADGANAPITVWNASAEGRAINYSLENWDALLPLDTATVDMVFINHGHNVAPGQLANEGDGLLDRVREAMPNAAIVVVGQNPQTPEGPRGEAQAENVRAWMTFADNQTGVTVIDVLTPFEQVGDYAPLLDETGVHPVEEGFAIWANTVIAALSAAS